MRSAIGLLAFLVVSSSVTIAVRAEDKKTPAPNPKDVPKEAAKVATPSFTDRSALLDPIQVDSLTLTPIVSTDKTSDTTDLLVLDEAMPKKLVRITEFNEGDVNNLTLVNSSEQPVFLLAGEVIIGGKQDRIIGRNTIIPGKTKLQVPVYCVEHGRWEGSTKEFTTAKALAHGRLRGKANFDSQQAVWAEVATKNEARKTKSSTDTYRQVATQQSDGSNASWQKRVDEAIAKLPAEDRAKMIGYAVALNGKIATVDVFNSPKLFKKLERKLVASYVTEAVDVVAEKNVKPPTKADVTKFVSDADKATAEDSYENDSAKTTVSKGHYAAKSGVMYKPKKGDAKGPPAAPVVETYQSTK